MPKDHDEVITSKQISRKSADLKYNHLTPEQYITLSELGHSQLIDIILQFTRQQNKCLDTILETMAAPILIKVRKAIENQYATAEFSALVDVEAADKSSYEEALDMMIDTVMLDDSSDLSSTTDIIRIASATPLRVNFEGREFLRLEESILDVSDYIDRVDTSQIMSERKRENLRIRSICSILNGFAVAYQYEIGQKLMSEHDYHEYASFFQNIFEIARRYKIANPEKMRTSYIKLMYFLMDLRAHAEDFCFDCIVPIRTVHSLLVRKQNGLALLKDPLIRLATAEIMPEGKTRSQIQWEIEQKEEAARTLVHRYATKISKTILARITSWFSKVGGGPEEHAQPNNPIFTDSSLTDNSCNEDLTSAEIELCLYSLGDRNTYLRFNCEPCKKMIHYLQKYFDSEQLETGFSLAIVAGQNESRLSHSHRRQYYYVLQSLTLWKEVLHEMLGLWCLADYDILNLANTYALKDSGQGLHRVQNAPLIYRSMCKILKRVQAKVGCWYGSSEIHLGDHNVPNALLFIDKYLQVPRILGPIILCLEKIPELWKSSPAMQEFIVNEFRSEEHLM